MTSPIEALREKGVEVRAPESIYVGPEVDLDRISGPDTVLYPGTRLEGEKLQIMPGCKIGAEGPATVRNCALGRRVSLKAGFSMEPFFSMTHRWASVRTCALERCSKKRPTAPTLLV
jgi:bifunctional N-acetylglucosamine-1-phosphate-uridyltransferase/glucosamine-1-phosphate-acetyltransferase GlmU-like protein